MLKINREKVVNILSNNKYPLLLIVAILVSLWPLSLFLYIPKWDNINGYLPYRYFISDYLWNGNLPLWNPFQNMGYPGYTDLQSGVWSPIVWIIMLFGKYTVNSLIIELLSCYVFAGLGMYALSMHFFACKKTSFILGLSYALSGFMVGSSQLMVFLIAATWFPWCIYALLNFFKTYQFKYIILSALFMAFFITGASPAYTILLAYIVVGIFIYQFIIKRGNNDNLKIMLIGGVSMLGILTVLILPYIMSFLDFSAYFNRVDKLKYDGFLLANPFTSISYISFLLPHAVIAKTSWFNITDLSLRNGYFGMVGLVGFTSAILSKISRLKTILLICLIFSLILAAGDETFLFEFLYNLPGFGVFRHPSIFRIFTIFCALLLAGTELKEVIGQGPSKRHKIAFISVGVLIFAVGTYAYFKTSFSEVFTLLNNISKYQEFSESTLSTHLLLNVIIVFLLLFLTAGLKKIFKLSWFFSLAMFCFLDVTVQTNISIPTTVVYNFTNESVSNYFDELPNDISQNSLEKPLSYFNDHQGLKSVNGVWQNVATFNKTISSTGVNPMRFKSYDLAKEKGRLDEFLSYSIIYCDDTTIIPQNIIVDYNRFSAQITNHSDSEKTIVLNQNYHHLWKAKFNGEEIPIKLNNEFNMKVSIPKKSSGLIEFTYASEKITYAFIISLLVYLVVLAYFLFIKKM